MYYFAIENEYGKKIDLTGQEDKWQLASVTGLSAPDAEISTSVIPTLDGVRYNSSRMGARNIVITLYINGNPEDNRNTLNAIAIPKRFLRVYYTNNSRELYADGFVETFEYDVFSQHIMAQISIICPNPFWVDVNSSEGELSPAVALLEFPISVPEEGIAVSEIIDNPAALIYNQGIAEASVEIYIESYGKVVNPWIANISTTQKMAFDLTLTQTQSLMISTSVGNKGVWIMEGGSVYNALMCLRDGSEWINLLAGSNALTMGADSDEGDMSVRIVHRNEYGGV